MNHPAAIHITPWSIPGSNNEPILGNTHIPASEVGAPRGVLLIAHGFKGYKDYGMFPAIAHHFAQAGFIAHRFNFSHAGMTNDIETFARPELFEQDTWNKQVFDLERIVEAVEDGTLAAAALTTPPGRRVAEETSGAGLSKGDSPSRGEGSVLPSPPGRGAGGEGSSSSDLPIIILGHSRGGMTTLLWAGRTADDPNVPKPAGLITLSAPARPFMFSPTDQKLMLEQGYIESPSSRTGQTLRVGKQYLEEMLADPEAHDVIKQTARIRCPLCIIHGENDPTVPASDANELAAAAGDNAETLIIPGADHVFGTPNPFPPDAPPNPQLAEMLSAAIAFAKRVVSR